MVRKDGIGYKLKATAVLSQAAPVQNTWYTVLDTTPSVELTGITVQVDTTGETLEVRVTVDGVVILDGAAAAAGTPYYALLYYTVTGYSMLIGVTNPSSRPYMLRGRSVKVEVRKTTAVGTGTLKCGVCYGKA